MAPVPDDRSDEQSAPPGALTRLWRDFRDFLTAGNLLAVAVAFVLGMAVRSVINSVVNDLALPMLGSVFGKRHLDDVVIHVDHGVMRVGAFTGQLLRTAVTILTLFVVVKVVEGVWRKRTQDDAAAVDTQSAETAESELDVLREMRDAIVELRAAVDRGNRVDEWSG